VFRSTNSKDANPSNFEAPPPRALTLSCQGTNLVFRSTNSKDTNPSNSEAPTPRALNLSCQDMFGSNYLLPKYSSLIFFNLQLHYSLHATSLMTTYLHMKESSQLFIFPTQSLQRYLLLSWYLTSKKQTHKHFNAGAVYCSLQTMTYETLFPFTKLFFKLRSILLP